MEELVEVVPELFPPPPVEVVVPVLPPPPEGVAVPVVEVVVAVVRELHSDSGFILVIKEMMPSPY